MTTNTMTPAPLRDSLDWFRDQAAKERDPIALAEPHHPSPDAEQDYRRAVGECLELGIKVWDKVPGGLLWLKPVGDLRKEIHAYRTRGTRFPTPKRCFLNYQHAAHRWSDETSTRLGRACPGW